MSGSKRIIAAFGVSGMAAVAAQFVLMRMVLVSLGGGELAIGLVITFWLLFAGTGSLAASRFFKRPENAERAFFILYLLLGALIPVSAAWAPAARHLLFGNDFHLGFLKSAALAALAAGPVSLVIGALFSTAAKALGERAKDTPVVLYLFEALGSLGGGVALSFVLAVVFPTLKIALVTAALCFLAGAALLGRMRAVRTALFGAFFAICAAFAFVPALYGVFDAAVLKFRFPTEEIIRSVDSKYQNFVVTRKRNNLYFYNNDVLTWFSNGGEREEEIAHIVMLMQGENADVLIVGNGWPYLAGEVLKHPVRSVDVRVTDEKIHAIGLSLVPAGQRAFVSDDRLRVAYGDPYELAHSGSPAYDAVFVDAGSPETLLASRYYTVEFLGKLKEILRPGGVVVLTAPTTKNYLSDALLFLNSSINRTLKRVFPRVEALSGEYAENVYIAGGPCAHMDLDPARMGAVFKKRKLETRWLNPATLGTILTDPRRHALAEALEKHGAGRLNANLKPAALFYALENREEMSAGGTSLQFLGGFRLRHFIVICIIIALAVVLLEYFSGRNVALIAFSSSIGFASIVMEMALLFALQVLFGYVYELMGIFVGVFMGGLALGSVAFLKTSKHALWKREMLPLYLVHAFFIVIAVLFFFAVRAMGATAWAPGAWVVFPLVMLVSGAAAGFEFSVILHIYTGVSKGGRPGVIYGADLLGGAVGGVFSSALLIPVIGIDDSILCVAALSVVSMVMLMVSARFKKN